MTPDEYRAAQAKAMTEAQLQTQVLALARAFGWTRRFHATIAIRSVPGFPDLVLVHPGQRRVLWRELKTERGTVTGPQQDWLTDLAAAGQDAAVWRPTDLIAGRIEAVLRGAQKGPRPCPTP